jgi:hypothetical protein
VQGRVQGQLLPQERPRRRVRRLHHYVHGGLWGRSDLLLPAPQLPRPRVWLSILAAIMSFAYSFIGAGLSLARTMTGEAYIGAYSVPNRNYSLKKRKNPHHTVKYTLILFYPNKLYIIHLYFLLIFIKMCCGRSSWQDNSDWHTGRSRCYSRPEDLGIVPSPWQHRLRVLLLYGPHRNPSK